MRFVVRTSQRQTRTLFARVVALLLLGGILHAVTFGAAHSHISAGSSLGSSLTIVERIQAVQAVSGPVHYRTDRQECLVCLFHQQLFNSVVHTPFFIAQQLLPETGPVGDKLQTYSQSFTSAPIARVSGRAPPRA